MRQIKLTNSEILQLDAELNGFQSQQDSIKGLLSEPLPIRTKYWLDRVNSQVASRKASIEKVRNEIVEKLGDEIDGVKQIPLSIESKEGKETKMIPNPKLKEFAEEFGKVLDESEEISVASIKIEDLGGLNTDIKLNVFFKLIEEPAE